MNAQISDMWKVIEAMEKALDYVEYHRDSDGHWVCPWCLMLGGIVAGHHPDCLRQDALKMLKDLRG